MFVLAIVIEINLRKYFKSCRDYSMDKITFASHFIIQDFSNLIFLAESQICCIFEVKFLRTMKKIDLLI